MIGLDGTLFDRCVKSKIKKETVLEDYEKGVALGVTGTPTYFVNGIKVKAGFDTLSKAIDDATKGMMQKL